MLDTFYLQEFINSKNIIFQVVFLLSCSNSRPLQDAKLNDYYLSF